VQLVRPVAGQRDLDLAGASVDWHRDGPGGLVGALRADGDDEPARTVTVPVDGRAGEIEIPLPGDGPYELHASVAGEDGAASPSTSVTT